MRYKILLEYLGTGLVGWQRQDDGISVQAALEDAILKFSGENVQVYAAGRTDAGVHALGQVCHFDLAKAWEPYVIISAVNHFLKLRHIVVLSCDEVTNDFHARFSAKMRHYVYRINNRTVNVAVDRNRVWWVNAPLDVDLMREAAQYLIGEQDFTSFRASACQAKSPIKTLKKLEIERHEDEILLYFSAQSFLHHMVRNIVGTLVLVGCGKWKPHDVKTALDMRKRSAAGMTASAHGLYFLRVDY